MEDAPALVLLIYNRMHLIRQPEETFLRLLFCAFCVLLSFFGRCSRLRVDELRQNAFCCFVLILTGVETVVISLLFQQFGMGSLLDNLPVHNHED